MAPRTWAEPDQAKYLNLKLEIYLQLQADKKGTRSDRTVTKFFDSLFCEWFVNWPEIDACVGQGILPAEASHASIVPFASTEEQDGVLQQAIKDRRAV